MTGIFVSTNIDFPRVVPVGILLQVMYAQVGVEVEQHDSRGTIRGVPLVERRLWRTGTRRDREWYVGIGEAVIQEETIVLPIEPSCLEFPVRAPSGQVEMLLDRQLWC